MTATQGAQAVISEKTQRLMRTATYAAVAVATLLIVVKAVALAVTGSVSIMATLVDSAMDAAASLVNLLAVRSALKPADRSHRFGHGKAEPLAGLGQSAFIAGSAVFLLLHAGDRLLHPKALQNSDVGIAVMLFSIVLTFALVLYQRHTIKLTGSVAIRADFLHYTGDLLVNGSVILALVLGGGMGWVSVDALFGAGIGLYILYNAWQIVRAAFDHLMDRELPDADRKNILAIVRAHPEVLDIHDLRTRSSGLHSFIQFHIEMDGALSLYQVHGIADAVEADIRQAYPEAEVIIHQDPAGIEEARATFT